MVISRFKTVACAISGGVDSAVAALLLKKQGYNVLGVFMRNWDIVDEQGFCRSDEDKEYAEYVCKKINIPFHEVNFVKEYWNNVFSYMINDYIKGCTPNPDILCNKKIKFDAFFNYATQHLKADAIATGHYARVIPNPEDSTQRSYRLLKGIDQNKDQTFFLAQIPQEALSRSLFPVGGLTKSKVKEIASMEGLNIIAKKRESAGICFIGRRKFQEFIEDYIEPQKGNFINIEDGSIVGGHKGVHCWTVGQRSLISGQKSAFYVAERNSLTQDILVAPGTSHPALFHQTLVTESPYWIRNPFLKLTEGESISCEFRFQHRKPLVKCLMYQDNKGQLQIFLEKPLRALTPGQFAVFYSGEECLGSAKIILRGPSLYALKIVNSSKTFN